MQYLALIYSTEGTGPMPGTPEFGEFMQGYMTATQTYKDDGVFKAGDALHPVSTATTVEVRGGETTTLDGPFAETKEQLGGYYLLDCKDLDEAIKYAAMIPTAKYGRIEVRPLMMPEDYAKMSS
jgi:hypothetical protein